LNSNITVMPFKKGEIPKGAKPFKKGDPRINRKGAPRLPDLADAMAKKLAGEDESGAELEAVIDKLVFMAKSGDVRAIKELLDRAYGSSRQHVDHTTLGESLHAPSWHDMKLPENE
jgi:hypothetical protein